MRISQAISDVLCKLHGAGVWKDIAQTYDLEFIHDTEHKQVVLLGTWDALTEARKEICKVGYIFILFVKMYYQLSYICFALMFCPG